MEISGSLLIPP